MFQFGRLITAMATPFSANGNLNIAEALKLGDHLVATGTTTILLAGTTGESPTLTHDEEFELFAAFVKHFKGRAKIMAGTGSNCTRTAIQSTQEAEKIGVDAVLQVVPYYNKPSQEGLFQHFSAIANSTALPILLYNIPGRTSRNMEPETVARLATVANIFGIKEAAGDVEQVKKIKALCPNEFLIYSGDDGLTLPFMKAGAVGVVSVAAHLVGTEIAEMMALATSGDMAKAAAIDEKLAPIFTALFIAPNPAPLKAALNLIGFDMGIPRLPLVPTTEAETALIKDALLKSAPNTQLVR